LVLKNYVSKSFINNDNNRDIICRWFGERSMKKTILLLIILSVSMFAMITSIAKASPVSFTDLSIFNFSSKTSSLKVWGTVTVYDWFGLQGDSRNFQNENVSNLVTYGWNDRIRSLTISGTVILYEDIGFSGNMRITFTSSGINQTYSGSCWNVNPDLFKSIGWDARTWYWEGESQIDRQHNPDPDTNNYMYWISDGLVEGKSVDDADVYWKADDFAQGFERSFKTVPKLSNYPQGTIYDWNDRASSLAVNGTVTLYKDINYGGANITYRNTKVYDLGSWSNQVSSLNVSGVVILYDEVNFGGDKLRFTCSASCQPLLLSLSGLTSLTLHGTVSNWGTENTGIIDFSGVKFDVWAVENQGTGNKLMLELYILRDGSNCLWPSLEYPRQTVSGDVYNLLVALDSIPNAVTRTVYSGNVTKWDVNVLYFILKACNVYWPTVFDIDSLYICKIGFEIESGYNLPSTVFWPTAECNLRSYWLSYAPSGGSGGGGCVLRNTQITMADGSTRSVQKVKSGDWIMGYDVQCEAFQTETVLSNNRTVVNKILSINDGLLQLTLTDQPIYADHGWVRDPQNLMVGWRIFSPTSNSWIIIRNLETKEGTFVVYDLRATDPDTFLGNGILLDRKPEMM
jgi:hypothetical protein